MEAETKTCCVTGHRDIPAEKMDFVKEALQREVAAAIEDGYTRFISGFAEGADLMFAAIVAEAHVCSNRCRSEKREWQLVFRSSDPLCRAAEDEGQRVS